MSALFPINVSTRRMDPVTAIAGQTVFPYTFPLQEEADISVSRTRAGTTTALTPGVHFTVSGAGNPAGGTVTLIAPALAGDIIAIEGNAVMSRVTSTAAAGKFSSRLIDRDLDRTVIRDQELARGLGDLVDDLADTRADLDMLTARVDGHEVRITMLENIVGDGNGDFAGMVVVNPVAPPFGAAGDGVTDDSAAVQAALDHLAAMTRTGILYINNPHLIGTGLTYSGTKPLVVFSPAPDAGKLIAGFTSGVLLDIAQGVYGADGPPIVSGLGFSKAPGSGTGGTALRIAYSTLTSGSSKGAEVRSCFVFRGPGSAYFHYGIDLVRSPHSTIDSNFIQGAGGTTSAKTGAGIRVNTWCNGLTVTNNKIRGFLNGIEATDIDVPPAEVFQAEGYKIAFNTISNCDTAVRAAIQSTEVAWQIAGNAFDTAQFGVWMRNILRPVITGNLFGWNGRHKDKCDIMLQRDDGDEADRVSRTIQATISGNRAFRQGNVSLDVVNVARGASTVIEYLPVSTSRSITGIATADPVVVTYAGGDAFADDDMVYLSGISGALGTLLNGQFYRVLNVDTAANTFELSGIDGTSFPAYSGGGAVTLENETGAIANGDVLFLYGIGGARQLNRTPVIVANLDPAARTFTARDYYTGADINSTAYTAYSGGGKITRYGRFLEIRGGAHVEATDNQLLNRNAGLHLWANTRNVTWTDNAIVNEDGSRLNQTINASASKATIIVSPPREDKGYRDGGAPGDGEQDDTPYLQALLTAGRTVRLNPDKTYCLRSQLVITVANTGIEGNSAQVLISTDFDNTAYASRYGAAAVPIKAENLDGVFVRNCRIRYQQWTEYRHVRALLFVNCSNIDISGNEIWNFCRGGIVHVRGILGGRIANNYIHDCYTNSQFKADGVTIASSQEVQITAIQIDDDTTRGSEDLEVAFNRIEDITVGSAVLNQQRYQTDGINIMGVGTNDTKRTYKCRIVHNAIRNTGDAIDCFGRSNIIAENQIERAFNTGVKLAHGAQFNKVAHNHISEVGLAGILIIASTSAGVTATFPHNEILHNTIRNVNRAYENDGVTKLVWHGADGAEVYNPAVAGQTWWSNVYNGGAGTPTAGVRIDVTAAATAHPDLTQIVGNSLLLGGNAKCGIFCETGAGEPQTRHYCRDNLIGGFTDAAYQDGGLRLVVAPGRRQRVRLTSDYTLNGTANEQPLFNVPSPAGAVNIRAATRYRFKCQFRITGMSTSSGTFSFGFAGTASLGTGTYFQARGRKSTGAPSNETVVEFTSGALAAVVSANTSATGMMDVEGALAVGGTAGTMVTLVPTVAVSVAAAAVIKAGSYFEIWEDPHPGTASGDFA